MADLAPIVLFVYNRAEHTRKTVEALQQNSLARQSELIIYADGPKRKKDKDSVDRVRHYLAQITGFRRVIVRTSEANRGLALSIINGVTEVVREYGRIIVLEDDLVVAPYFLNYMNDALTRYAEEERVMHVSGYWFPITMDSERETFFLSVPSSWGWATWARAWSVFEKDPEGLVNDFSDKDIHSFNLEGTCNFWEQVRHNIQGKANTWAIFWYASIFKQKGLCLYPPKSLVANIGHDGTGVHCLATDLYRVNLTEQPVKYLYGEIRESSSTLSRLKTFYRETGISRIKRFFTLVIQRIKGLRPLMNK